MKKWKQLIIMILFIFLGASLGYVRVHRNADAAQAATINVIASCKSGHGSTYIGCMRQRFITVVKEYDFASIIGALEQYGNAAGSNETISATSPCHAWAHVVGEVAAIHDNNTFSQHLDACGLRCGYGCIHGVVIGTLKQNPTILSDLPSLCVKQANNSTICSHAVGHFLAEYTGLDVHRAVSMCDSFTPGEHQYQCWSGIFMEIYNPGDSSHEPKPIPKDPTDDCRGLPQEKHDYCMRTMIGLGLRDTTDVRNAFFLCSRLRAQEAHKCFVGIGSDLYALWLGNIQNVVEACIGYEVGTSSCIEGVVNAAFEDNQNEFTIGQICDLLDAPYEDACSVYVADKQVRLGTQ